MPGDLILQESIFRFLLAFARVAGWVALVPLPGFRAADVTVRAALALAITITLYPVWPSAPPYSDLLWSMAAATAVQIATGLVLGLVTALFLESFQVAAQIAGLQAGFSFASTVDPGSQADSGVLLVAAYLSSWLFFFAAGLDRDLLAALGASFTNPPRPLLGSFADVAALGSRMFSAGLAMALPLTAILFILDISLALLGRLQQQLQLLTLAFPVKILVTLAMMALLANSEWRLWADGRQALRPVLLRLMPP
ncbi:MAG: flagellar biosynthetic protein FliR [Bryobacteraceae bacterium]|nr:flagellar biosynthetic protein FliR [Bryobacteraceae bacterium]